MELAMSEELNQKNKKLVWEFWQLLENANIIDIDAVAREVAADRDVDFFRSL